MDKAEIQSVLYDLADIIWWIKGYNAGRNEDSTSSDLGAAHIEALRKTRLFLEDSLKGKK